MSDRNILETSRAAKLSYKSMKPCARHERILPSLLMVANKAMLVFVGPILSSKSTAEHCGALAANLKGKAAAAVTHN